MSDRKRLLQANLRTELVAFIERCFATLEPGTAYRDNWHIQALARALTRVWQGDCKRLIINVPPRSMKSITVSVAFTEWVMGQCPHKRVMAISYAADLSRKLGLDTRTILESPWFQELFPACQIASARAAETSTTRPGYLLAGSVTGPVLGRGADLIVVDDPIKG
jgi:hypothetical protein